METKKMIGTELDWIGHDLVQIKAGDLQRMIDYTYRIGAANEDQGVIKALKKSLWADFGLSLTQGFSNIGPNPSEYFDANLL